MYKVQIFRIGFNAIPIYSTIIISIFLLLTLCTIKRTEIVNQLDGLQVPTGFSIERAVSDDMVTYPMFASFDDQGRLFVFESDGSSPSTQEMLEKPSYFIRLLEDTNGDGIFDESKIFADSLTFPKGGVFYKGSLYVSASPDLLRLTDIDGDGVADEEEVLLTGWILSSNGAALGGPFFGPDGWMYITDARRGFNITTKEGNNLKGNGARIWRCRPDGSGLESICSGGFDNAIELIFMPSGETIGTMTYFIDPQGGMRDALIHWVEGGVYPKVHNVIKEDKLKLTGDLMPVMTKMARVAPSGIMRYRGLYFGEGYLNNLFSAEFNTGRVMRHQIISEGASYKTIEEPFITSTVADIHLTDVLEDADGSLLVLNTGGWFITGCPLSVVAKLNVHGGIYRIRKNNTDRIEDAGGLKLSLSSLSIENLVEYAKDRRFAVRDKVIERLVEIGGSAVAPIKKSMLASEDQEVRTAAVFALARIKTSSALNAIHNALSDPSMTVRTAAARVLGLLKYKEAITQLANLVQNDEQLAVRRQAATALGQIGDSRAVDALLLAAEVISDRFVEHAIIYALMELEDSSALIEALKHSSTSVRKVAVIALDQMEGSILQKEHLVQFLSSEHDQLWAIGIWVASHHPEWADMVINFLKKRLDHIRPGSSEESQLLELMIAFSDSKQLQDFVGAQIGNVATSDSRRALFLDVVTHSVVQEIPNVWVRQLGKLLQKEDSKVRLQVLEIIKSRRISTLNDQLDLIIQNSNTPANVRLKAVNSRHHTNSKLSDSEFQMVLDYLDKNNEPPTRQLAAGVLAQMRLSDRQLIHLAKNQVTNSDLYLLPNLITTFKVSTNEAVGKALISALHSSPDRLDNLSEQDLQELLSGYPISIQTSAKPLIAALRDRLSARLSQLQKAEAQLKKGDVGRGRLLFLVNPFAQHAIQWEMREEILGRT
jgi:putative membrane-bound dehydrogenase-like protein